MNYYIVKEIASRCCRPGRDMMGYRITKNNYLTYHHIFKKVYGDYSDIMPDYDFVNGAVLTLKSHEYLHLIESRDLELFNMINRVFSLITAQKHPATQEQQQLINDCLYCFEVQYRETRNNKGRRLIKKKYFTGRTG